MTDLGARMLFGVVLLTGCSSASRPLASGPDHAPPRAAEPPTPTTWVRRVDWDERMHGASNVAVADDGTIAVAGFGRDECFVTLLSGDSPRWTYWYGERGCECEGLDFEEDGAVTFGGLTHVRNTLIEGGSSTVPVVQVEPGTGREVPVDSGLAIGTHVTQLDPSGEVRWRRPLSANQVQGPVRLGRSYAVLDTLSSQLHLVDPRSDAPTVQAFPGWGLSAPAEGADGLLMFGFRQEHVPVPDHPLGGYERIVEAGVVAFARGADGLALQRRVELDPSVDRLPHVQIVRWGNRFVTLTQLADGRPLRVGMGSSEDAEIELPTPEGLFWHLHPLFGRARVHGDVLELVATRERRPMLDEAIVRYRVDLGSGHLETAEHELRGDVRVRFHAWGSDGTLVILADAEGEVTIDGSTLPERATNARTVMARLAPCHAQRRAGSGAR